MIPPYRIDPEMPEDRAEFEIDGKVVFVITGLSAPPLRGKENEMLYETQTLALKELYKASTYIGCRIPLGTIELIYSETMIKMHISLENLSDDDILEFNPERLKTATAMQLSRNDFWLEYEFKVKP